MIDEHDVSFAVEAKVVFGSQSSIMSDRTVKCQMLKLVGHVPASCCCSSLRNARSVIMLLAYMSYKIFLPSADMQ